MKYRQDTRAILARAGVAVGADFHTLRNAQVEALLAEADRVKYRKPRSANGSRARYFHDMLQRRVRKARYQACLRIEQQLAVEWLWQDAI